MTLPAPTYDLVLLLDPQAEDDVRAKLVADTRAAITAQGELLRHDEWGERALSYPIERRNTARYHLLQFHAGSAELLQGLDRTLHLADEVLRFRIIKLAPGVSAPPDMGAAPARPAEEAGEPSASAPDPAPEAEAAPEPAPEPEAASEAEAASEPESEAAPEPQTEAAVGESS
jgi:small subunit ribosomal protein S6